MFFSSQNVSQQRAERIRRVFGTVAIRVPPTGKENTVVSNNSAACKLLNPTCHGQTRARVAAHVRRRALLQCGNRNTAHQTAVALSSSSPVHYRYRGGGAIVIIGNDSFSPDSLTPHPTRLFTYDGDGFPDGESPLRCCYYYYRYIKRAYSVHRDDGTRSAACVPRRYHYHHYHYRSVFLYIYIVYRGGYRAIVFRSTILSVHTVGVRWRRRFRAI